MSAEMFLANWLAHDYLHIRQLIRLRYHYLEHAAAEVKLRALSQQLPRRDMDGFK
jgi:hypothetical protein